METKNIIITNYYKPGVTIEYYTNRWAYYHNGSMEELKENIKRWVKSSRYYTIYDAPSEFLNSHNIVNTTGLPEWD